MLSREVRIYYVFCNPGSEIIHNILLDSNGDVDSAAVTSLPYKLIWGSPGDLVINSVTKKSFKKTFLVFFQNGWYFEDGTSEPSNSTGTYQLFNIIGEMRTRHSRKNRTEKRKRKTFQTIPTRT